MRRIRFAIIGLAAFAAAVVFPAVAAADCTLTNSNNGGDTNLLSGGTTQTFTGHVGPDLNGKFIQIPFDVGTGIKGMKIRYCFAKTAETDDDPTLDLGVYGAKPAGASTWTQAERRGWSGSSVRTIGIGENGYTDETVYNEVTDVDDQGKKTYGKRKNYVPGHTSRAFKPGPIEEGTWAVELGAGWIDPDGAGVDWRLEVITSTDPGWSNDTFVAEPYAPNVANPNPGWYQGDLHVHGESEPGNAPMNQTLDLGFKPLSEGGSGLDFINLVEHNNDNSRLVLGSYQAARPGKVIIPGVEVTTYNGHTNAQGSNYFADFRMGEIYRWDDEAGAGAGVQTGDELTLVRGETDPSSQFPKVLEGGGFTQVNHPDTAREAPAACRGCAWTYSDERTGWNQVSALEIQNGAAGIPKSGPSAMNPFTIDAIATYERLLGAGNHIAAVGSSDDHQAGEATGPFDGVVGRGATAVYANELSQAGIVNAVKAGHTYVKFFGADGPDVELKAGQPGKADLAALPGDSVTGPSMNIQLHVTKAGASATRPGPYTLEVLQDGVPIDSVAVTSDDFHHNLNITESGRYSFKLTRPLTTGNTGIEAYSTPVWFTRKSAARPSRAFRFAGYKLNRKRGTAKLKVKVKSRGKVTLRGRGLKRVRRQVRRENQTVTLNLRPKAWLKKKLRKRGRVRIKVKVRNKPNGAKARTKSKRVKLVAKKAKKKRNKRRR